MAVDRKELAAWAIVQAADPRTHDPVLKRTIRKRDIFRGYVDRKPGTGCWLWHGPADKAGRARFYDRDENQSHKSVARSAFVWMLEQWFPGVELPDGSKGTVAVCGSVNCLSPFHRQKRPYGHLTKMSPATVREVYALRTTSNTEQVALRYGLGKKTVWDVWTGRTHRDVTGARRIEPKYRKFTPEDAIAIYSLRNSGRTKVSIASDYGVTPTSIRRIWNGEAWADVTGHACQ